MSDKKLKVMDSRLFINIHTFDTVSDTSKMYKNIILEMYIRMFQDIIVFQFQFIYNSERIHHDYPLNNTLSVEDMRLVDWMSSHKERTYMKISLLWEKLSSLQIPLYSELKLTLPHIQNILPT